MRYIVIGAGAVGGSIGARLFEAGKSVVLVARGQHLAALRSAGLTFLTPAGTSTLRVPAVAGPAELILRPDDILLLSVKLQDSASVLDQWAGVPVEGGRTAGEDLPLFCVQNGVEGERLALRRFANVYGVCVMLAASHLEPGEILANFEPVTGILTIGRYPAGSDEVCRQVSDELAAATFRAPISDSVMRWKYTKLLANLGNAVEAIVGTTDDAAELHRRARAEGVAVLAAAGIDHASEKEDARTREGLRFSNIPDHPRGGVSSWQSITRGAGSVETDYLTGEIVLLGRLHGVPTPVNATLQRIANLHALQRVAPAAMTVSELTHEVNAVPG
ncbi:MAG: 2-dehydropantoate 2-reductase N-terminal domain-containing protein [Nakamurella sp.]